LPIELIIDTDAGIDDAQAILLAAGTPGVAIAAITTLSGNVHVDKVTRNVLLTLDAAGKRVPVYRGADRPLVNPLWAAEDVHGEDGLGNVDYPVPPIALESEHAALALTRMAAAHPRRYTLVAIGPLTNVALATRLDPSFPNNLANFVFMGGAYAAIGNTNIVAEFNVHTDPEAAAIVLDTFPRVTMVSWELSLDFAIAYDEFIRLRSQHNPRLDFFNRISAYILDKFCANGNEALPMPDPLAVALAIDPTLATEQVDAHVHVELAGTLTRGQTVVHWKGDPRVKVIKKVDAPRFWAMMKRALGAQ